LLTSNQNKQSNKQTKNSTMFHGLKIWKTIFVKARVHCFLMQVVMNKCFLLNLKNKNLAQIRLVVFEKNAPLIPKNDITEPKARLL